MKKYIIKTIHEHNLKEFLSKLGLLDDLLNGKIRCIICEEIVTMGNVGCIFSQGEKIFFCCNKLKCLQKVSLVE